MDLIDFRALNQTRRAAEGTEAATRAMQKSLEQMAQGTVPAATFNAVWAENQQLREDFRCADENLRLMEENRNQFRDWGREQAAKAKQLQAELDSVKKHRDEWQAWGKEQAASTKQLQAALEGMKKHRDEWQAWGKEQQARADKLQAELNALRQAQGQTA